MFPRRTTVLMWNSAHDSVVLRHWNPLTHISLTFQFRIPRKLNNEKEIHASNQFDMLPKYGLK